MVTHAFTTDDDAGHGVGGIRIEPGPNGGLVVYAPEDTYSFEDGSGTYRIRIGSFETRQEAEDFRKTMQQQFPGEYGDAWIIVPDGGSK